MYSLYKRCWRKSFDYNGYASRREFASFFIFGMAIIGGIFFASVLLILVAQGAPLQPQIVPKAFLACGVLLALIAFLHLTSSFVPAISLLIRRSRDIGLPLYSCLIFAIPIANIFAFLLCLLAPRSFIAQCRGFKQ